MAGDFAVVPRHFLMGCSCDQLLELRSLTDDGLLHGFALNRKNDHVLSPCFAIMTFYLKLRGGLHRSLLVFLNLLMLGGRWKVEGGACEAQRGNVMTLELQANSA